MIAKRMYRIDFGNSGRLTFTISQLDRVLHREDALRIKKIINILDVCNMQEFKEHNDFSVRGIIK